MFSDRKVVHMQSVHWPQGIAWAKHGATYSTGQSSGQHGPGTGRPWHGSQQRHANHKGARSVCGWALATFENFVSPGSLVSTEYEALSQHVFPRRNQLRG